MKNRIKLAAALAASGMAAAASPAYAVSYASGVRNTGGSNWEFVLNETAGAVTILRDGGNQVTLNAPAAGRHTFDMTGFTNFEIKVETNTPAGWAAISDAANMFTNFERPNGVVVNNIPTSPYFGTIYVSNPRSNATGTGRAMGDGVYALTADQIGVNLSTRAAVDEANDPALAIVPTGWNVGVVGADPGTGSPWRLSMDDAGNLIAADWSDGNGGIKYASADLTTGGSLLLHQDGVVVNEGTVDENGNPVPTIPLLTNTNGEEVHGSIVSRPYVTGTLGQDLVVYGMDEDRSPKGVLAHLDGHGNSIWKWNVGSKVGDYDQTPQLMIDVANIPDTSTGGDNFMSLDVGVLADALYSPATNKWYLVENRDNGDQAGLIVITPDGVDGSTPTLEWSSLQFTGDNGLDGFATQAGLQDAFRRIKSVEISPDGKTLFVSRAGNYGDVLTTANGAGGAILAIPLDAQGVPALGVADGKITNIGSIEIASNTGSVSSGAMAFDAAGNLYTTSNVSELMQVFSPGGNWLATTTSAGAFTLTEVGGGLDGDFNGDQVVNGADFLVWQQGGSPNPLSQADLTQWKNNFGATAATSAVGAVPEPATLALAAAGVAALATVRRRR